MTDIEMTRLCAEAIGLCLSDEDPLIEPRFAGSLKHMSRSHWEPLHNDVQAMRLLKSLQYVYLGNFHDGYWVVDASQPNGAGVVTRNTNLNRAIVECVAKMQAAKEKANV